MSPNKAIWSSEDCNRRHRWITRANSAILIVLGLQMTFIGWSIQASTSAAAKVEIVSEKAGATSIRVEENWQSSLRQLDGVKDALKSIQDSQVKSDDRIIAELQNNRALVEKLILNHNADANK